MDLTEREKYFYDQLTEEPKRYYDIVSKCGMNKEEYEPIIESLKKKNAIIMHLDNDNGFGSPEEYISKKTPFRPLTPADKDKLLDSLLESTVVEQYYSDTDYTPILKATGLKETEIHALLVQFESHRLITYHEHMHYGHKVFGLTVHQSASDFKLNGGYIAHDILAKAQLEKLLLEIAELEKTHSWEKLKTMTTIVSNILTTINILKPS